MGAISTYVQKIHTSLQGMSTVRVSSFVEEHVSAKPILHPHAGEEKPDLSALIYSILRLPPEILHARTLVFGQSDQIFERHGFHLEKKIWQHTSAVARSRKCMYNPSTQTLAVFVSSVSDVEDAITILTGLYIEMQKLHRQVIESDCTVEQCFATEDAEKMHELLGGDWNAFTQAVRNGYDYELTLLAGSMVDYSKIVQEWWVNIARSRKKYPVNVYEQPVYFVSSNSHSLINILSGVPLAEKQFLLKDNADRVKNNAAEFKQEQVPKEHILYYLSRFSERKHPQYVKYKLATERKYGLYRMEPFHNIDIEAQIFSIRDVIKNPHIDKRLRLTAAQKKRLAKSNALILNIAYPLGMAAYSILREVSENAPETRGVYIMGKAASLNASVGDITIPNYAHDLHTRNTFFIENCFDVADFLPYVTKNSILAQQKSLTVRGTYLQSEESLHKNAQEGYSIIEMEAGPYLNRLYEMLYPLRYPENETVNINPAFRLGMAYYVSDTPHKKGLNLGAKRLTWEGLNGTYAISLGIVKDIFSTELKKYL